MGDLHFSDRDGTVLWSIDYLAIRGNLPAPGWRLMYSVLYSKYCRTKPSAPSGGFRPS